MSHVAQDLIALVLLAQRDPSALTQRRLRELAQSLIAPGVADARDGC
jgi:hypothetical protein